MEPNAGPSTSLGHPRLQIMEEVQRLNKDPKVHGVILHLPHASFTSCVLNAIAPDKDVEGCVSKPGLIMEPFRLDADWLSRLDLLPRDG